MTKKHANLKLFVWESVFCDYSGIAFALAETKEAAIETILTNYLSGYLYKHYRKELESVEPEVIDPKTSGPRGWQVSGGG